MVYHGEVVCAREREFIERHKETEQDPWSALKLWDKDECMAEKCSGDQRCLCMIYDADA
jgi:hypothetical protein